MKFSSECIMVLGNFIQLDFWYISPPPPDILGVVRGVKDITNSLEIPQ